MSANYEPPFTITSKILSLTTEITEILGFRKAMDILSRDVKLRKVNRVKTIQGSLAIEGNTLTEQQITAIMNGKRVIAPIREIQEVRNAIRVYDIPFRMVMAEWVDYGNPLFLQSGTLFLPIFRSKAWFTEVRPNITMF